MQRRPLLLVSLTMLACTGAIDNPGAGPGTDDPDPAVTAGAGGAPVAGRGGGGGSVRPPPPGACDAPTTKVPRARVWRLSPAQYANSVKDLFGVDVPLARLPRDATGGEGSSFDTDSNENVVHERLADVYAELAGEVAGTAAPKLMAEQPCLASPASAGCAEKLVEAVAGKAFRRPLEQPETKRYSDFLRTSAAKYGAEVGLRMTLEAVLQAPAFLYRTELGTAGAPAARAALTQHELASQLAYLIADGPPGPDLLKAASEGRLTDRATVRKLAEGLLTSPRARAKAARFFEQLVHLQKLADGQVEKDPKVFPQFTPELQKALFAEFTTFLDKVLWEERGTLATVFSADFGFVNGPLAALYGVPGVPGTQTGFTRVALPKGQRAGLLGQAGVLATLGGPQGTSPSHRGLFFFQTMLCQSLPLPPPDASTMGAKLVSPDPKATQREHFEYAKRVAPECSGCHGAFLPLGLSLETFDGIGRYRETEFDKRIDTSVELRGFGDADGSFRNGLELAQKIIGSEAGRACFAQHYASYALGRTVDPQAEACELRALGNALQGSNLSLQALMLELTQQDSFYFRRTAE